MSATAEFLVIEECNRLLPEIQQIQRHARRCARNAAVSNFLQMVEKQQWLTSTPVFNVCFHAEGDSVTSAKKVMFSLVSVCLLTELHKNYQTNLHDVLRKGWT